MAFNAENKVDEFLEKIFSDAFESFEDCGDCKYYLETPDMYSTGDSPTGTTCEADEKEQCPLVQEVVQVMVKFKK